MTSVLETAGGYVVLTGYTEAEDDGFNAYCPELGVATCGDTVAEVLDGLQDALEVYIADGADLGNPGAGLSERGRGSENRPLAGRFRYCVPAHWQARKGLCSAGSPIGGGVARSAIIPANLIAEEKL